MNESLRGALLRAGLSEEDVAARLQVDPKTVRRWLEGRVPHLRHRWVLAGMLGVDEADLWTQLRAAGSMPAEVHAVYPHLADVPRGVWLHLFGSARREIDILAGASDTVIGEPGIGAALAERAHAGIAVRVCLLRPDPADRAGIQDATQAPGAGGVPSALAEALGQASCAEIRLRRGVLYAAIYRADDEILISQRSYGTSDSQAPVLHIRGDAGGPLATAYLESFQRLWNGPPAGK